MKKILLVDDQPNFIKMVSIKLSRAGYDIVTADNGQAAIERARQELPDLIIMDIMMPVMDGFTAAERIKADAETAAIPLIFLSAKGQESDKARAKVIGAIDFISKPFSPQLLVERVSRLLE